jgi:hypothetical protein
LTGDAEKGDLEKDHRHQNEFLFAVTLHIRAAKKILVQRGYAGQPWAIRVATLPHLCVYTTLCFLAGA